MRGIKTSALGYLVEDAIVLNGTVLKRVAAFEGMAMDPLRTLNLKAALT